MSKQPLVVAVQGSPREGGNTTQLLEAAVQGALEEGAQVEWVRLNRLEFVACQDCGGCLSAGVCVIQDAMQDVYALVERMDAMLLASPIYFGNVSAQTKAMIDRAQPLWVRKEILGRPLSQDGKERPVLFLSALGGDSHDHIRATRTVIEAFAHTFDGPVQPLIYPGVDEKGEIAEDWTALTQAHEAAASLVRHLVVK